MNNEANNDNEQTYKTRIRYFPMDVDLDEKFELLEAKHGC